MKITLFRPPKAERQKLSSTSMCWYLLFLGDPRPLVHIGSNIIGRSSVFTTGASVGINCFGNHTAKVISTEIHVRVPSALFWLTLKLEISQLVVPSLKKYKFSNEFPFLGPES